MNTPIPLRAEHLRDARLFANRRDMISALSVKPAAIVAEIGVAIGDFSQFMIETLGPKEFYAFDTFTLHELPMLWGNPTSQLLEGKTHFDFYRDRFARSPAKVLIKVGQSHLQLAGCDDRMFDLIYVDAGHTYDEVKLDAEVSLRKIRNDGFLVFNDYIIMDHILGARYGVVHVVNELVTSSEWKVIGLALQEQMFCDIALSRGAKPDWKCR